MFTFLGFSNFPLGSQAGDSAVAYSPAHPSGRRGDHRGGVLGGVTSVYQQRSAALRVKYLDVPLVPF